jgi:phosphoglycolate phosphatase
VVESKLHHYKNWIFDWSGTLVDDLAMVLDATNHVLRKYGKGEMEREDFRMSFRLPYAGYYEEILPGVPLQELEDHFREGFAHSEASGVTSPLLPYALEFLECLHAKDKRMFILSSMDALAFERHVVELGIDHFFEATYAGVLDKRDQIHSMLENHALESSHTVFLGDMCHDIETAKHGGLASIALLTGYQNEEQLQTAGPDLLVGDLSEIHQLIENPQNPERP